MQFYPNITTVTTNEVQPYFRVINETDLPIPLSELEVRYFFTSDAQGEPVFACHYSTSTSTSVDFCEDSDATSMQRVKLAAPAPNATYYLSITWPNEEILPTGGNLEMRMGYYETKAANAELRQILIQDNDYSFDESATATADSDIPYADFSRLTVYRNGVLVAGEEPCTQ
jgi:hypothetical protein